MENQTLRLSKGDQAPVFTLTEADGKKFSLSEVLKEGSSLLLIFCHGAGCNECETRIGEIEQHRQRFEDRGIRPVVITSKTEDYNKELKENLKLSFAVLADDGTVSESYGIPTDGSQIKPTLLIVDRHGIVDWTYDGKCEPDPDWPTPEYIFRHMVMVKGI